MNNYTKKSLHTKRNSPSSTRIIHTFNNKLCLKWGFTKKINLSINIKLMLQK